MRREITPLWGERVVELRETKGVAAPWGGGVVVFAEFLRKVEFLEAVGKRLPFLLTSPNAIDPVQTFPAFLASVWTGAQPFAHTGLLRTDAALRRVPPCPFRLPLCTSARHQRSRSLDRQESGSINAGQLAANDLG